MEKEVLVASKAHWDAALKKALPGYKLYAPLSGDYPDYQLLKESDIQRIVYNGPRPVTPLKAFFLPFIEKVSQLPSSKPSVIMGVPSCDLTALSLLDAIYLNNDLTDAVYQTRRERTVLLGSDCYQIPDHCHCASYGVNPYPEYNHDLTVNLTDDKIFVQVNTKKGKSFLDGLDNGSLFVNADQSAIDSMWAMRKKAQLRLQQKNADLPDYNATGELIKSSDDEIWQKYASRCVSCGACAAICPTCSCFLLIDLSGFEKLRRLDACQYPGFSRVAAGGDPLKDKTVRFRNRYLCKYVWKPERFAIPACTGCGRCTDACIGKIDKNELFRELSKTLAAP